MQFDRAVIRLSVATRHLLEARLHLAAAVEAMSDVDGFHVEYLRAVELREELDELFLAADVKSVEVAQRAKIADGLPTAAE